MPPHPAAPLVFLHIAQHKTTLVCGEEIISQ